MDKHFIQDDDGLYHFKQAMTKKQIISLAISFMEDKAKNTQKLCSSEHSGQFFCLHLANHKKEVFAVAFLNNRHQLICYEELFFGTINATAVYPREILRRCLELDAVAIVVGHNHLSGDMNPSQSDKATTGQIRKALSLIDVRLLDHIIVSGNEWLSMSELGLM